MYSPKLSTKKQSILKTYKKQHDKEMMAKQKRHHTEQPVDKLFIACVKIPDHKTNLSALLSRSIPCTP